MNFGRLQAAFVLVVSRSVGSGGRWYGRTLGRAILRLHHHGRSDGDEYDGDNVVAHVNIDDTHAIQEHQAAQENQKNAYEHGGCMQRGGAVRKSFKTVAGPEIVIYVPA